MAGELIFLTGGTGFLGRHLVPRLIEEGYHLRLLIREPAAIAWLEGLPVQVVQGDLTDPGGIEAAMEGCAVAIHTAAHFRFWGPARPFELVNVQGTKAVAKAARLHKVKKLVHISAVAVVGRWPAGEVIDEQIPCQPQDHYQRTKLAGEQEVLQLARQQALPAVVLRPGAFYGPYGDYGFNRLFIADPLRGLRIQVEGGRRLTFPVFVPDVAEAVGLALQRGRPGQIYNICDEPVSHARVNQLVSEYLGISPHRWNVPRAGMILLARLLEGMARLTGREPFYPLNLRHYVFNDWRVSSEKARRELGFQPTPLAVGLRETTQWYLSGGS